MQILPSLVTRQTFDTTLTDLRFDRSVAGNCHPNVYNKFPIIVTACCFGGVVF